MARRMTITDDMIKIDRKCIEAGITRSELSRRSGVPVRTLEAYATRHRTPRDVYVLQRISKVLGCTIEDLIEPEPGPGQENGGREDA